MVPMNPLATKRRKRGTVDGLEVVEGTAAEVWRPDAVPHRPLWSGTRSATPFLRREGRPCPRWCGLRVQRGARAASFPLPRPLWSMSTVEHDAVRNPVVAKGMGVGVGGRACG